ncbi:MAG: hypothetical protein JWO61_289, partial [Candidatus Saccharibacteria bacterium]|nr:hypothetical protein [Candidatus Saccharibacteria bacterium]
MSNNPQNAERRITLLYEAYPHEESSDTEEFELERARQELANLSKEFEARALNRERELSETNRTRLLGIAGFIRICISDEEDAAIYKYREEQGWKARDIDDEMVTSLRRGLTLSTKETPPELELPEIELGEYEQLDLYA